MNDARAGIATNAPPCPGQLHETRVSMAHGAGGEASRRLIEGLFAPLLGFSPREPLADAAVLPRVDGPLAFTTDSFVVRPLMFPGGSIGSLAVHGTLNDLAVSGARPIALSASFILEAELEIATLRAVVESMADAARKANVSIVTGDTKVVERGAADGLYITTTGLGQVDPRARLDARRAAPGDRLLLSGPLGAHGITILLARSEIALDAPIASDSRNVWPLVEPLLAASGECLKWMRDATRGGLATALNEFARDAGRSVQLREEAIPTLDPVRGACELLGLDPLHVANEGQFVAVVAAERADAALAALRAAPGGAAAVDIGQVVANEPGRAPRVLARSGYGGTRVVDMLSGDPLPRIC